MIDFETFSKIRQLFDQKQLKVSQIAAELGLHEATVAKWVQIHKYRPRQVMIDNLKTGVLHHPWGEKAHFNPRYVDFAGHYGFEPVACAVGKANQKGRVENGVGYVKNQEKLIATHPRCYDRHQDIRNPDHERELLVQRQKARRQTLLLAFLSLSPQAELYGRKLDEKRLNASHHIQKIVALSEIYGPDKLARAIADAIAYEAYGCEYIANILEQRERIHVTPTALHLTRRQDLLDLEIPAADLTPYEPKQNL